MRKIILIVLILNYSLFACCGCALVSSSTSQVKSTAKSSLKKYDSKTGDYYLESIVPKLKESLKLINIRFVELENNLKIENLDNRCSSEELEELKKINELESIKKTTEIMYEFSK